MVRILGLDPGLRKTGWGIIDAIGSSLKHIAHGVVTSDSEKELAQRLVELQEGIFDVIMQHRPEEAAVEQVFLNKNPVSTIKLGMARGVVLYTPAKEGLFVSEYPANLVKKSVVGSGHAEKEQVLAMINMLLPTAKVTQEDAADALAIAICHAHHRQTAQIIGGTMAGAWQGAPKKKPAVPRPYKSF